MSGDERERTPSELRPWTVALVLEKLPTLLDYEQRLAVDALASSSDELVVALERALPGLSGPSRGNAATFLLRLQAPSGRDAFLAALADEDPVVRSTALSAIARHLVPKDSALKASAGNHTIVPLSCAEVFAAIRPLLASAAPDEAQLALFACLKHDFAASLPITQRMLTTASGTQRLLVANWYLRSGRDDGALDVLAELLAAAPANPHATEPRWYDLKSSWRALADFCRRVQKPPAERAARLAMAVVTRTLDSPDRQYRFDPNKGFVSAGDAAEVIAATFPERGEALLRRLAMAPISSHSKRGVLRALCRATGDRNLDIVIASLTTPAMRDEAAQVAAQMAKAGATAGLLEALTTALVQETQPETVGKLLAAMTALGDAARPHIEAALERADPWERMSLGWQIQGGTLRGFADLLVESGAADPIDDAGVAKASGSSTDLFSLLWAGGNRLAQIDVKSAERAPPHHKLFGDLLSIARPRVQVDRLVQHYEEKATHEPVPGAARACRRVEHAGACFIEFEHEGKRHSFAAHPSGRWLDVGSVIKGFNTFMQHLGRDDRCYQFQTEGTHQFFAVAPEKKFRPIAQRLRIPLQSDPAAASRAGMAYVRQVVGDAGE